MPGPGDSIRAALIGLVRRGHRTVLWGTDVAGFANNLYLWQRAAASQRAGGEAYVLRRAGMQPWLAEMPAVEELLTIDRDHVRFVDRRDLGHHQVYGEDFDPVDQQRFIEDFLLPAPLLAGLLPDDDPHRVVLNVRRGDYYSDPVYRGQYSFDVVEYVRTAMQVARRQHPVDRVHVVSDDIGWCRDRLSWLSSECATTFAEPGRPASHFRQVAGASRLILANSTFSYWGAYVSVVNGADPSRVIAPWFHNRLARGGAAWQLDPRWTVISEVRGGWDA